MMQAAGGCIRAAAICRCYPTMGAASGAGASEAAVTGDEEEDKSTSQGEKPTSIDKSKLTIGAPRRYRNREHIRFVARQPCLLCGRKPSDPHHSVMQPRALGRKASDSHRSTLPHPSPGASSRR